MQASPRPLSAGVGERPCGMGAPKNTPQNISLILLGRFVNAQANCDIWPFIYLEQQDDFRPTERFKGPRFGLEGVPLTTLSRKEK